MRKRDYCARTNKGRRRATHGKACGTYIYREKNEHEHAAVFPFEWGQKRERERDDSFRALCGLARRQQQLALHARGVLMLLSVSFEEKKTQWSNSALR